MTRHAVNRSATGSSAPTSSTGSSASTSAASSRRGAVVFNGRFLTQKESGVQRFSYQLLKALDALLARDGDGGRRWVLLVPPGARPVPFSRIEVREVGQGGGHRWDQALRFHCHRDDVMVNLANSGPLLRGRSLSVIHDAAVFRTPANFTFGYRTFHRILGRLLALRARIGTVSNFSRGELAISLGLAADRIAVIPNSSEHLLDVVPDPTVLADLGLERRGYFLAIGSPVPNKNLVRAIEAFGRLERGRQRFVVVGSVDRAVFGDGLSRIPEDVVMAGGISDAKMTALLQNARALVFPSLYEGFGIPPLEAMQHGCPVVASRIPPVQEVCGDAVVYFDPLAGDSIAAAMRRLIDEPGLAEDLVARGRERVKRFSWASSAELLRRAVDGIH